MPLLVGVFRRAKGRGSVVGNPTQRFARLEQGLEPVEDDVPTVSGEQPSLGRKREIAVDAREATHIAEPGDLPRDFGGGLRGGVVVVEQTQRKHETRARFDLEYPARPSDGTVRL